MFNLLESNIFDGLELLNATKQLNNYSRVMLKSVLALLSLRCIYFSKIAWESGQSLTPLSFFERTLSMES